MDKQDLYAYESTANDLHGEYQQLAALLPDATPESDAAQNAINRLEGAIVAGLQQPAQADRAVLDRFVLVALRALRELRDLIDAAADQP